MVSLWRPAPDRVAELYAQLAEQSQPVLQLSWRSPGRRAPDHDQKQEQEAELEDTSDKVPASSTDHMDFEDDEDESVAAFSTPSRHRTPGNLKGSARKKTTSLDGVLSNMRRHRIEEKEYGEEKKS